MYRNMSPKALGVSGRQSELIELALTYGFKGIDIDMRDFAKRWEKRGEEHARRFFDSSRIKIGGWDLPVRWEGELALYKADLAGLEVIAQRAAAVGSRRCYTHVPAASDSLPYHELYEQSRTRLREIADVLAPHDVHLGVGFNAAPAHREGKQFQFIHKSEELLSLVKAIGAPNLGLALDTWNWKLGEGGMDQLDELPVNSFVLIRLADLPDDVDPSKVTDQQRRLPGEGGMTPKLLNLLAKLEYAGPVTIFPHPKQFAGMTREAIVQRASAALDEQWKAAGLIKTKPAAVAAAVSADEEEEE
ncbi:MAG: sugar phosphate isomerase/epimerase [Pirellulaceae bacterium]